MKRTELAKGAGKKIESQIRKSPIPGRPAIGAVPELDRREQRKRDQAQGLVAFAVKLNGELVKQLHALAQERGIGLNELTADLLNKGLKAK